MTAVPSPNDTRGDRWLSRVIDRVARLHPRLGMLRFEEALRRNTPELMHQHRTPGVQVSFSIGGCATRTLCFGLACTRSRVPVDSSTLFRLGSVTKPLAALGVLALVRDGVLNLDESVHAEIEEFFNHLNERDRQRVHGVTMRNLLSHTTGLAHFNPPRLHNATKDMWLNSTSLKFESDPGTKPGYSGVNYAFAEVVVEKRTRQDFPALMRERVLTPLGMTSSRFERELHQSSETLASDHDKDGGFLDSPPSVCHASSGLVSSTAEVCRGLQTCHFTDGFLPPDLSQLQFTPQPHGLAGATATLGMHLHKGTDARSLSHGGTRPGHRSLVVVVPEARAVLCIAANSESGAEVFKPITGFFRAITIGV